MTISLQTVKSLISKGEYFKAYDTALKALEKQPDDIELKHRALLALANAGATEMALKRFVEMDMNHIANLDVQCLLARLHKDMGFSLQGEAARASFMIAGEHYEKAWQHHQNSDQAYYPAINAAACAVFSKQHSKTTHWAKVTIQHLNQLKTNKLQESEYYWTQASQIEALLILGQIHAAQALLSTTINLLPDDRTSRASTRRQLQRLCSCLALNFESLGFPAPSRVLHYTGHLTGRNGRFPAAQEERVRKEIIQLLSTHDIGVAYGSLAGGADILFAEAVLERGGNLHVVLPFARSEFLEVSVLSCGPEWAPRFERCLALASSLRMATEDSYLQDDQLFNYCSQLAMGMAILNARHLNTEAIQIAVWDGQYSNKQGTGTEADILRWREAGHAQRIIHSKHSENSPSLDEAKTGINRAEINQQSGRQNKAMLFADVKGFSKLHDRVLPVFVNEIMGKLAEVSKAFQAHIHSINTWGDGIFAVFHDVSSAAQCATHMQEKFAEIDRAELGLPEELGLRIGLHLGPVYLTLDPITQRETAIGAHVSRAARIEPITPEGCVYVTETFAAALAISTQSEFACDYVGQTETAKNFGSMPMFLLRRSRNLNSSTVIFDFEQRAKG